MERDESSTRVNRPHYGKQRSTGELRGTGDDRNAPRLALVKIEGAWTFSKIHRLWRN